MKKSKSMKSESDSSKKLIKFINSQPNKRRQTANVKNEREDILADLQTKRIKRNHELYPKEFDTFDENDTFLEISKIPKLTKEEIDSLNSPMSKKLNF